jgi:ferritin-like metal-binding protein YciE
MAKKEQSVGLRKLLEDQLADTYYAEKQLVKALPKLARTAVSDELREAFEGHLEETREQVSRLEQVFQFMEMPAKAKKCPAIDGILEEGTKIMEEFADDAALDAGLVSVGQKAEHYEIASYGCMVAWAAQLGLEDVAGLLSETLEEEKGADEKLSAIAETVNDAAEAEGEGEEELVEADEESRPAGKAGSSSKGGRSGAYGSSNGPARKSSPFGTGGKSGSKR